MEFRPDGSSLKVSALWMSSLESTPENPAPAAEMTALLEQAMAGDSAAFEQILIRHERRVLRLAWRPGTIRSDSAGESNVNSRARARG